MCVWKALGRSHPEAESEEKHHFSRVLLRPEWPQMASPTPPLARVLLWSPLTPLLIYVHFIISPWEGHIIWDLGLFVVCFQNHRTNCVSILHIFCNFFLLLVSWNRNFRIFTIIAMQATFYQLWCLDALDRLCYLVSVPMLSLTPEFTLEFILRK